MTEKIGLEQRDVYLQHISSERFIGRTDGEYRLHIVGNDDSTWIEITKQQYEHLKQVVGAGKSPEER